MVIFVGSYEGKAKSTGNPFQRVTLMEARNSKKESKIVGRQVDFFVSDLDCSDFECGDVVKAEFEESEFLGGTPELVGLEKVGENVFKKYL